MWASAERCHQDKHVCALCEHVHSHSDLHRGHTEHIESLFLSLDLLTGQMAAAEAAEAFFSGTRRRALFFCRTTH